ncbi:MAG TPA: ribonuclease H-like domain-containing protein [Methanocorpusculum sp.]|nr:ribonuclease H-like domain-containing protein [Methanocorpusculum sp.]HJJ39694.1 ribonuclease H-like domain-containing protein [Methanocorpusculum sp.]HJJ49303.1 ribonuclease H-like domain-containing protein [Methanocorpusculum sp.]HJJ56653.1 ribonuclease H-like domain-containing protein [Methanocorpusculum sp.]
MTETASFFTPASILWKQKEKNFGEVVDTPDGSCLRIQSSFIIPPSLSVSEDEVKARMLSDFTLVPGIGPVRSLSLKQRGKKTISDLRGTPWESAAEMITDILLEGTKQEILQYFSAIHRSSDPMLLALANPNHTIFFDIETLGMAHAPIILFGCGRYSGRSLAVTQYLIRNVEEELPALLLTANEFTDGAEAVTYNGKSFDIPYLNERLSYYGEREVQLKAHFDLLPPTRKLFKHQLCDCRLETVESAIPSLERGEDVPGALVPYYYHNYLRTGKISILKPVIEHNKIDVANLAYLLNYECDLVYV